MTDCKHDNIRWEYIDGKVHWTCDDCGMKNTTDTLLGNWNENTFEEKEEVGG